MNMYSNFSMMWGGYIYSLDNALNTEGAAHRNIFIMANLAFSVGLNIY